MKASRCFGRTVWRAALLSQSSGGSVLFRAGAPLQAPRDLWHAMNPLSPGLNRVEADELSYGLHILIRTELEIALLEGAIWP